MKFVRFLKDQDPTWGHVQGESVFCLAAAPYESLSYAGESLPLRDCALLAPCEPTKIVCVGKNYYDHAVEMGDGIPDHPILFLKGPNTLNHPCGVITAPDFVTRVDYEGELAVVIRRRAKNVKADQARDYIPPAPSSRRTASGPVARAWTPLDPAAPGSQTKSIPATLPSSPG